MFDYLNANGLVNGKVPAGKKCPHTACNIAANCRANDPARDNDFSCGLARLYSIAHKPKEL